MRILNKSIDNGVIRINDLSILQFSNSFRGYFIISKRTGIVVPKFMLFWKGYSIAEVKTKFELRRRGNDN